MGPYATLRKRHPPGSDFGRVSVHCSAPFIGFGNVALKNFPGEIILAGLWDEQFFGCLSRLDSMIRDWI
jgi:hypothetical protein